MKIEEVLLGGVENPYPQNQVQIQPQANPQQPAAANPFANLTKIRQLMDSDPQKLEESFREMAKRGIQPPPFTPDNFLEYMQTQQSQGNQAMKAAGSGVPPQGQTPYMPPPQSLDQILLGG